MFFDSEPLGLDSVCAWQAFAKRKWNAEPNQSCDWNTKHSTLKPFSEGDAWDKSVELESSHMGTFLQRCLSVSNHTQSFLKGS